MNFFFCLLTIFIGIGYVDVQADGGDFFRPKPEQAGAWVTGTQGEIWPKPLFQNSTADYLIVHPKTLKTLLNGIAQKCEILLKSINRFEKRIFPGDVPRSSRKNKLIYSAAACLEKTDLEGCDPNFVGILEEITILLESDADCSAHPYLNMVESYEIFVNQPNYKNQAHIRAKSVWGILRGLESFSHLIYNTKEHGYQYQINTTYVNDAPRFSHRGVMLDSSRHYLSKKVILVNLDLMEINKFNVFHWHLTDHTSFPYQSQRFPNLSEKGAYDPETHVYTPSDVAEIIEEARLRGIRVIPEFDSPGHTKSWEAGQPGLLTQCEDSEGKPIDLYGPIDPTEQTTYDFLAGFFDEITRVFPDKYIHIGGDEVVEDSCWPQNKKIRNAMTAWNIHSYKALESFYIDNLLSILEKLPIENGNIVWQEVFDNGDKIRPDTIVEVWKDWADGWRTYVSRATNAGYQTILAAPWYLNDIRYGSEWTRFYRVEPMAFGGNSEQKKLLIGGEVCLWGEFVNSINAIPRLWPRASAAGEKLWSTFPTDSDINLNLQELLPVARRLQEHECRMLARGFPVQPVVGAGYCPVHWDF